MNNTLVSLEGVSKGKRGLHKVSESEKNGHFTACFPSYYLLANSREECYFKRKKDKNLLAISKEQGSTLSNLHFQIKCYS